MSATCRSCGAPIVWAVTSSGKRMPLDATPDRGELAGKFFLVGDKAISATAAVAAELRLVAAPGYTSHFATCPNAGRHRKPR